MMKKINALLLFILAIGVSTHCQTVKDKDTFDQKETSNIIIDSNFLLDSILQTNFAEYKELFEADDKSELQIIYTQINRDANNKPSFRRYSYNLDAKKYFNPASFVKLPTILLALEKIRALQKNNFPVSLESFISFDSGYFCQTKLPYLYGSDRNIRLEYLIQKALLISDDKAYNRLYEFNGQQYLNEQLWKKGYKNCRIVQRFQNCSDECNRYTNPYRLFNDEGDSIYFSPMQYCSIDIKHPLGQVYKGKAYSGVDGKIIHQPKNYSQSNNIPLEDMHQMMLSLFFPDEVADSTRFNMNEADRAIMIRHMALFPAESSMDEFKNKKNFPDHYKKYFLWGTNSSAINKNIRSYNINAFSHGYIGDCAYIVDDDKKIEFFLLAVLNTNPTDTIHPSKYRYQSVGIPFLEKLGTVVYQFEIKRERTYLPNFAELQKMTFLE